MFAEFAAEAGKRCSQAMLCKTVREESHKFMIWLLLSVSYWPIIMIISPGGLLLVVYLTYLQSQFQLYGWGCKKVK